VLREGGLIEEIRQGDIVWLAPDEKHWQSAAPTTTMSHITIREKLNGWGGLQVSNTASHKTGI